MKRSVASVLTMLLMTLVGMAGTATAASGTIAKVNIPFEFSVGDQTYPAGEYSLTQFRPDLVAIYDAQGRNVGVVLSYVRTNLEPPAESKMKFEVVDGHYELAEVVTAGESTGAVFAVKGIKRRIQQASSAKVRRDESRDKATQAN